MAGKHFVGADYADFTDSGLSAPVSRVTMMIDSETALTAGDDTGSEMRSECPFATQEMVETLLARVRGYRFQMFSAEAARLDPTAELGDAVDIGGVHAIISHRSDDGSMCPDIAAVGEAELEDDYPTEGPQTRAFNLDIAQTRSLIARTSAEIRLEITNEVEGLTSSIDVQLGKIREEVSDKISGLSSSIDIQLGLIDERVDGLDGRLGEIEVTAESVTQRVNGLDDAYAQIRTEVGTVSTKVSGLDGQFSALEETVKGFTFLGPDGRVMISNGSLDLTGAITFSDLDDDTQNVINSAKTRTFISQPAGPYYVGDLWYKDDGTVWRCKIDETHKDRFYQSDWELVNDAGQIVNNWSYVYDGKTYIDGEQLMTGTVTASKLQGGTVYILDARGNAQAAFDVADTNTGEGLGIDITNGFKVLAHYGNIYLRAWSEALDMGLDATTALTLYGRNDPRAQIDGGPLVSGNQYTLGTANRLWGTVYSSSGSIQTSDRDLKHDIEPLPGKYVSMIDTLRPVRYKYDDGTSNRYHVGFIAQDVLAAMDELGIDTTEFGGYVVDIGADGNLIHMLRYEEFTGIIWAKLRELTDRIKVLEAAHG